MRWYLYAVLAVLIGLSSFAQAQDPTPDDRRPKRAVMLTPVQRGSRLDIGLIDDVCKLNERKTVVYHLKSAAADEVAESLNRWLQTRLPSNEIKVDGFICNAPVIIVPDNATNSLVVSMSVEFQDKSRIEQLISTMDRSAQIQIQAVLKKTVDGKTTLIGSPTILVRENLAGSVTLDIDGEQYTIELSAQVIESPDSISKPGAPRSAKQVPATTDRDKKR